MNTLSAEDGIYMSAEKHRHTLKAVTENLKFCISGPRSGPEI